MPSQNTKQLGTLDRVSYSFFVFTFQNGKDKWKQRWRVFKWRIWWCNKTSKERKLDLIFRYFFFVMPISLTFSVWLEILKICIIQLILCFSSYVQWLSEAEVIWAVLHRVFLFSCDTPVQCQYGRFDWSGHFSVHNNLQYF